MGLLGLDLSTAAGLVESGRGDEVLHDGAVASEFVRGMAALRGGFGDDCLQQGVLFVGVVMSASLLVSLLSL
jgi:hypothetical protein